MAGKAGRQIGNVQRSEWNMNNKIKPIICPALFIVCFVFLMWGLSNHENSAQKGNKTNDEGLKKQFEPIQREEETRRNISEEDSKEIASETEPIWSVVPSDEEFTRLIAENPIDQYFTLDRTWDPGVDRMDKTGIYRELWKREIENALQILKEYLSAQDYERLKQAHENRMEYIEKTEQVEHSLCKEGSPAINVEGKLICGSEVDMRVREVKAERIKNHAIELMSLEYAFTGTIKFYKETARIDGRLRLDDSAEYWAEVEDSGYQFPKSLFEEIVAFLKEGRWEEKLGELSIECKVLNEEEKRELISVAEGYSGVSAYCEEDPMYLEDPWYLVDLSEKGKDLVIDSYDSDGEPCIYYFENLLNSQVYTEPPIFMNGSWKERPYFIKWEGSPYIAVPIRDKESEGIVGIEVYYCREGLSTKVTGIWINHKGEGEMKSRECFITDPQYPPEGWSSYPTVLPGSQTGNMQGGYGETMHANKDFIIKAMVEQNEE